MRIFILENAKVGESCRAIVCVPNASSGFESNRAMNMRTPNDYKIVLKPAGQSQFIVTESQFAGEDLADGAFREAQNLAVLEVVYSSDESEVPAFSFLGHDVASVAHRTGICISIRPDAMVSELWSFRENLDALREFEIRLRMESVVSSIPNAKNEISSDRYSDDLARFASSVEFQSGMFLPLFAAYDREEFPCVVQLQQRIEANEFHGEIYWVNEDGMLPTQFDLKNPLRDGTFALFASVSAA